jgi:hypothetical protein
MAEYLFEIADSPSLQPGKASALSAREICDITVSGGYRHLTFVGEELRRLIRRCRRHVRTNINRQCGQASGIGGISHMVKMPQVGRTLKSFRFQQPATFEPDEILSPNHCKHGDSARWFGHQVLQKEARGEVDEDGYARLHSKILRRVMGDDYASLIKSMVSADWLEPPAPYSVGEWSKGYQLSDRCCEDHVRWVSATDPRLIYRIEREWERLRQERQVAHLPIHRDLEQIIRQHLTITPDAAQIVAALEPNARLCQESLVADIRSRDIRLTVSRTGRCFTPFTGLGRTVRPSLRLDDEQIAGMDICCAQPSLLSYLLNPTPFAVGNGTFSEDYLQLIESCPFPLTGSDVGYFRDLALNGTLYETLIDLCGAAGIELPNGEPLQQRRRRGHRGSPPNNPRDAVKLLILRDVLAKRGNYFSAFESVFEKAFPTVLRFVRWVNQNSHCTLIRMLQQFESWLVIQNVAPRLVGRIPILTLHDAIYGRKSDLPVVEAAFDETFSDLGFRLSLKP